MFDISMLDNQLIEARTRFADLQGRERPEAAHPLVDELLGELSNSLEELRVVEEELRAQNGALTEAHEEAGRQRRRYQELFDLAPVAYIVTDAQGVIAEVNQAAAQLTRRLLSHLPGKPLSVLIRPTERGLFREHVLDAFKSHEARGFETWLQPSADADPLPVSVRYQPVFDQRRGPLWIRWVLMDKTPEQTLRNELHRLNNDLWRRVAEQTARLTRENDLLRAEATLLRLRAGAQEQAGRSGRGEGAAAHSVETCEGAD